MTDRNTFLRSSAKTSKACKSSKTFAAAASGLVLAFALAVPASAETPADESASSEDRGARMWQHFSERFDTNGDGVVTKEEYQAASKRFERHDSNDDGQVTADDFADVGKRFEKRRHRRGGPAFRLMRHADVDQNGELTSAEWQSFLAAVDADSSGTLTAEELSALRPEDAPAPPEDAPVVEVSRLQEMFNHLDDNGDGVITEDERPRRRGRGRGRGGFGR